MAAYSNVSAYSKDLMALRDLNVHMTDVAVHACDELCKSMKFFTLQTGTNVSTIQKENRSAIVLDVDISRPMA